MEIKRSNFYSNGEIIDYSLPQSFKKSLTKDLVQPRAEAYWNEI